MHCVTLGCGNIDMSFDLKKQNVFELWLVYKDSTDIDLKFEWELLLDKYIIRNFIWIQTFTWMMGLMSWCLGVPNCF